MLSPAALATVERAWQGKAMSDLRVDTAAIAHKYGLDSPEQQVCTQRTCSGAVLQSLTALRGGHELTLNSLPLDRLLLGLPLTTRSGA